jgi:uncharacterized membrane protein
MVSILHWPITLKGTASMKKLLISSLLSAALLSGSMAMAQDDSNKNNAKSHYQELMAKLPVDKQALVKNSFKENRAQSKTSREQMKALQKEINAILIAPSFDKSAFIDKSKQLQDLRTKITTDSTERTATLAAQLSAEERAVLAEMRPHPRMNKMHKKSQGKDAPKEAPKQ